MSEGKNAKTRICETKRDINFGFRRYNLFRVWSFRCGHQPYQPGTTLPGHDFAKNKQRREQLVPQHIPF